MAQAAEQAAAESLAAAYPGERERDHAGRWLGLLAGLAGLAGKARQLHWREAAAALKLRPAMFQRRRRGS